jgi:peptidoglycan/xylan/chitin deacetylase (PgdA/CDA1 family)
VTTGYRRGTAAGAAAALALLLTSACGDTGGSAPGRASAPSAAVPTSSPTPSAAAPAPVDPASVRADELGAVPVLMYHQLLPRPVGGYDQTPAQFRAELTALYTAGYRTVTAADLVAGKVDIPAGRSPMVLTFDDSTVSQYAETADGSPAPGTAVAILLEVAKAHGEQRPVATFYVNEEPFGRHPEYLPKLAALGMELGDHTATHANLRQLSGAGVQAELAKGLTVITQAVPGAQVTTMALPFGAHPHDAAVGVKGTSGGTSYAFAGVLLVGSNPAPSPYSARFAADGVPRIRSGLRTGDQAFTSTYWLPRLAKGQVRRYVSDGDPATVAFPKAEAAKLAPRFRAQARPY